jgi:hypothetical protein
MINGKLQEFVSNVNAKGQIGYGDVRRLQRDYLPDGITNPEELELLIAVNAGPVRADRAWAQWLVAAVAEFVAKREGQEHPGGETADEWIGRLLAGATTSLGRRIARQIRCVLGQRSSVQSKGSDQPHQESATDDVAEPSQAKASKDNRGGCPRTARQSRRHSADRSSRSAGRRRHPVKRKMIASATPLGSAEYTWCLAGHLPAISRTHLINFQSSRVSVALAPCR